MGEEVYLSSINLAAEDVVVERIQSQLVAGFIYRYTILLPGAEEHCVVTIYEHWSGTTEVVEETCHKVQVRDGGLHEEKVDDPELLRLLEEVYLSSINLAAEDVVV